MTLSNLHQELGLNFQQSQEGMFWQELTAVTKSYQQSLGMESAGGQSTELAKLAEELGKERVAFGPRPDTIPLSGNTFTKSGAAAPPYLAELMKAFDFYLVNLPIVLLPRPGGGFSQLDCIVELNPGSDAHHRPVAYQIFPQEVWQDVIRAHQGVSIGVNEDLEFKIDPTAYAEQFTDLPVPVKAAVELKAGGNAGFVIGPFDYRISTPKITSRGRGDAKIYWRLEGENQVTQQDPRLGVIIKVPRDVHRVNINAVLAARRTFHLFTSELRHVFTYLSDRARTFFEQGAPASAQISWENVTA